MNTFFPFFTSSLFLKVVDEIQNINWSNVERLGFRNLKITNIKISRNELFDFFIYDLFFYYLKWNCKIEETCYFFKKFWKNNNKNRSFYIWSIQILYLIQSCFIFLTNKYLNFLSDSIINYSYINNTYIFFYFLPLSQATLLAHNGLAHINNFFYSTL